MFILSLMTIALASSNYDQGVQALQDKDYPLAIKHLSECVMEERDRETLQNCLWELGWANWMLSDWKQVIQSWETLQKGDPNRSGLEEYLSQARDNYNLEQLIEENKKNTPKTYATNTNASVRLRAVGDMMIGTDFPNGYLPPNNGANIFDGVKDELLDADLTFGNLEGPLCDSGKTTKCKPGAPSGSCYAFRTPSSYGQHYKDAGFDVVSTANNHSGDFGQTCRIETEKNLDLLGIKHSGRPGDIATMEVNGLKIAVIGFHTNRACHYVNDHDTAKKLVESLSNSNDIVIVSFHGGAEGSKALHVPNGPETFYGENRGDLRKFARVVIDAGADAVIGHGPHVLRGMEIYKNRLIAYSLGNFATYGRFSLSGQKGKGVILELSMNSTGEFTSGKLIATKQVGKGIPVIDEEKSAIDTIRLLSQEDFGSSAILIAQDGTIAAP